MKNVVRKNRKKLGISWYISLIATIELSVLVVLATIVSYVLEKYFGTIWSISPVWLVIGVSVIIGSGISVFVTRTLLSPIRNIARAMKKVANGDYNIQVEQTSRFGDIEDIYQSFNLMTKELASTEILKTDFISNVSHEIKTPITAVEGYAMLLQGEEGMSEERGEYIEKILINTRRLSELVNNTLLLSKIDNQSINTKQEEFSLDEQIRQSILLLELKWTEKNIDIQADMQEVQYVGNKTLMMHVWNNLIGNAIKFTPEGSTVRISLACDDNKIIFSVDDEGEGIDEASQKHIFDKFYQGDNSHKQEGNGLGLALVKHIVALSGGEISVKNLLPGCRFTVVLPG